MAYKLALADVTDDDVRWCRLYIPGYVGGAKKVAKMTDEEIKRQIVLNDTKAKHFNETKQGGLIKWKTC